jgi:hypothetical protein
MWGYSDLLYFVLFSVPAIFFVAIICAAGFMGLNLLFGWNLGLDNARVQAPLVIVIQFFWWLLVFAYIYVVVTSKYDLPFGPAIGWKPLHRAPAFYLLSGVALAVAVAGISALIPRPETTIPMEALLQEYAGKARQQVLGRECGGESERQVFASHNSERCDEFERLIEDTYKQHSHHGGDGHGEDQGLAHTELTRPERREQNGHHHGCEKAGAFDQQRERQHAADDGRTWSKP